MLTALGWLLGTAVPGMPLVWADDAVAVSAGLAVTLLAAMAALAYERDTTSRHRPASAPPVTHPSDVRMPHAA
jgi:hypothetical protein